MKPIRLLLVDDHAVVREGYRRLLDAEADMAVCAEAESADEACRQASACEPDVVVMDLNLGSSSGLEAMRRIKLRQPSTRLLVFSMYDAPSHVTQALRAGAQGYLSKCCHPGEMTEAVRRIARGERVLSSDVAQALAQEHIEGDSLLARLTPREFEILRLTVRGDPVSVVAERLHLSAKTVFNHLSSIRAKLEVSSDFQLLQLAARHGLVDLPTGRMADVGVSRDPA